MSTKQAKADVGPGPPHPGATPVLRMLQNGSHSGLHPVWDQTGMGVDRLTSARACGAGTARARYEESAKPGVGRAFGLANALRT